MKAGLSEKQKRFADEFLKDSNGTQAAIRAKYAKRSAEVTASRLLRNAKVIEYLQLKREKLANKMDITQERILAELANIAFSDIRQFYDIDGSLRPLHVLPEAAARALAGVEVEEFPTITKKGEATLGYTKKIKQWDKLRAIEVINRMLGFNAPEKNEHTGKNGAPLFPTMDLSKLSTEELEQIVNLAKKSGVDG